MGDSFAKTLGNGRTWKCADGRAAPAAPKQHPYPSIEGSVASAQVQISLVLPEGVLGLPMCGSGSLRAA